MSAQDRENGSPSGRWTPRRATMLAMLAIGLIGGGVSAFGQTTLYDETRVGHQTGSACGGAAHCKTYKVGRHNIEAGQNDVLTFQCPDRTPYFAGWETSQNEHIRATMLPQPPLENGDIPTGPDIRLVLLVENVGTGPGHITVFLGCSTEAILPTRMMRRSGGIPSNRATFKGGN
jgi:hypothetical protein